LINNVNSFIRHTVSRLVDGEVDWWFISYYTKLIDILTTRNMLLQEWLLWLIKTLALDCFSSSLRGLKNFLSNYFRSKTCWKCETFFLSAGDGTEKDLWAIVELCDCYFLWLMWLKLKWHFEINIDTWQKKIINFNWLVKINVSLQGKNEP
jgi:hypothetical protein